MGVHRVRFMMMLWSVKCRFKSQLSLGKKAWGVPYVKRMSCLKKTRQYVSTIPRYQC